MDNPFHFTPKKPLNVVKKPWTTSEFWSRFFPMEESGDILFTPPWPSATHIVNDGQAGRNLIKAIKKGLSRCYLILILILILSWLFFWNKPEFLLVFFLSASLTRAYARKKLFPELVRPHLANMPLFSREIISHTLIGTPQTKRADGRFLWSGLFLSFAIPALAYWWDANDICSCIYTFLSLLALFMALYSFWPLLYKRDFPSKILIELGISLLGAGWVIAFFYYYMPAPAKTAKAWGYDTQSPSSSLLGFYQDYMSPVSLDRRLQNLDYRPLGLPVEWTRYLMPAQEFNAIKHALEKTTGINMTEKNQFLTQKEQQNFKRQRFPEWWTPSLGSPILTFSYDTLPAKIHQNNEKKQTYSQGKEVGSDALFPGKNRSQTLIYDEKTGLLYMESRQNRISPFENYLMYLD